VFWIWGGGVGFDVVEGGGGVLIWGGRHSGIDIRVYLTGGGSGLGHVWQIVLH